MSALNALVEGHGSHYTSLPDFQRVTHGNDYGTVSVDGHASAVLGNQYGTFNYYQNSAPSHRNLSDEQKLERLIASLVFERMDARLHNIATALPTTCTWIFNHSAFTSWLDNSKFWEHGGFLWIKGKPGCGKSTIIKGALRWIKMTQRWTTISYFFNARATDPLERSALGLYRSLVHQVLQLMPQFVATFKSMFFSKCSHEHITWTITELQEFLVEVCVATKRPELCLVVDALDEGSDSDVRALVSFLEDLSNFAKNRSPLRMCLSSRHYPHITVRKGLSLVVEEQREHNEDVRTYVRNKLVTSSSDHEAIQLQADICRNSAGVFLWVVLVIAILNHHHDQGKSFTELRRYLNLLPQNLEGLFAEILTRNTEELAKCVTLLQCVLYSTRPLQADELYLAIEHSQARPDDDIITVPSKDVLNRYLLNCSRGLVELTRSLSPVVQFIHETVREFLLGEGGLPQLNSALAENLPGWSHAALVQICLNYFIRNYSVITWTAARWERSVFETNIWQLCPLIRYVAMNLLEHAEAAQRYGVTQKECLKLLLTGHDKAVDPQFRKLFSASRLNSIESFFDIDITLLYIVAQHNYSFLTELLADGPEVINARGGKYGNALSFVCFKGNAKIVQCLHERGADINNRGGIYGNALQAACAGAKPNIVKYLLKHGADVNARGGCYGSALASVVETGDVDIVRTLLEFGADPNAQLSPGYTVLSVAISNAKDTKIEIVESLITAGLIVRDDTFALYLASKRGWLEAVRLLVTNGSDINAVQEATHFRTALCTALGYKRKEIVEFLLDHDARHDSQCEFPDIIRSYIFHEDCVYIARQFSRELKFDYARKIRALHDIQPWQHPHRECQLDEIRNTGL